MEIILPTSQTDIGIRTIYLRSSELTDFVDLAYDEALNALKTRPRLVPPAKSTSEREKLKQDYYRSVRTNVLLFWTLRSASYSSDATLIADCPCSNAALAAFILHGNVSSTFSATKDFNPSQSSSLVRRADKDSATAASKDPTAIGNSKTVQLYMV